MMKLLAWDTSTRSGCVVAAEWGQNLNAESHSGLKVTASLQLDVSADHSEKLLWAIDQVLKAAAWELKDIHIFGVGVGPGSFTGLRIGITTARTLAHAMNKKVVAFSSLVMMARSNALLLPESDLKNVTIITAVDASKGEWFFLVGKYSALRDCVGMAIDQQPGVWRRGIEEVASIPENYLPKIKKKLGDSQWLAVGNVRGRRPEFWSSLHLEKEYVLSNANPVLVEMNALELSKIVYEGYIFGSLVKPLRVLPRYLRASDAEVKMKAGLLKKSPTDFKE